MVVFAMFPIFGTAIKAPNYESTMNIPSNMMREPVSPIFARYERHLLRGRRKDAAVETRRYRLSFFYTFTPKHVIIIYYISFFIRYICGSAN